MRCVEGTHINDPAKPAYTADVGMQRLAELAALVAEADKVLVMPTKSTQMPRCELVFLGKYDAKRNVRIHPWFARSVH